MFPWNAAAPAGDPYTPQYVLPAGSQTGGRFDLADTPTLYLALEDPAHALAEVLQSLRGKRQIRAGHLHRRVRGEPGHYHPLAVVETWLPEDVYPALPDLGVPENLVEFGIRPDDLSSRDRAVTQRISRKLHDDHGLPGFRWWSAFGGQWHVAVLYMDRVDRFRLHYGTPDPLHLAHPVVRAAARELHIRVARA
ncbi:MAG TPA: RES domain-containing protein [Longimicrobiaceae bacterium]|nr:RES domain-containing protein [Longimicrobiaceae bacterium]